MTDRRRTPRYVLGTPIAGDVLPMQDVTVESSSGSHVVVVSPTPHEEHAELLIHMAAADGPVGRPARVISCRPVSIAGKLCFRLELEVDANDTSGSHASGR